MKKQPDRTSRLVWPTMLAIHIVGEEHRLDRARLVVAIKKLAQTPRQKRHQLGNFAVRRQSYSIRRARCRPQRLVRYGLRRPRSHRRSDSSARLCPCDDLQSFHDRLEGKYISAQVQKIGIEFEPIFRYCSVT